MNGRKKGNKMVRFFEFVVFACLAFSVCLGGTKPTDMMVSDVQGHKMLNCSASSRPVDFCSLSACADVANEPFGLQWLGERATEYCTSGMNVVSVKFLVFVFLVVLLYFLSPKNARPWVLLCGSVFFYSIFSVKAMIYLGLSILSVYVGALCVERSSFKRTLVCLIVGFNIGILVLVKYGGCFSFPVSLIVPLGISFYTLQAIAYIVDVGRGVCSAERNLAKLMLFLSFFPTIMQGPISRYGQLGCQLWKPHEFDFERLTFGSQLVLWGFFKKLVIADRAALFVDRVFDADATCSGILVVLAAVLYSVQIYADFSGCVDISRGIAECLGIDLIQNFNHPYFATSVQDFWRRWHISLSSWLKDYVYIPLGGNRHGKVRKYLNIGIVFGVSGLWHGTGLNFFIWGLLHGIYQIFGGITLPWRERFCRKFVISDEMFSVKFGRAVVTFFLVTFAWVFFRSSDAAQACKVIQLACVWNPWVLTDGTILTLGLNNCDWLVLLFAITVLVCVSVLQESMRIRLSLAKQVFWFRWMVCLAALLITIVFGIYGPGYSASQFIYMQF